MIAVSDISRELARDAIDDFRFWLTQRRKRQAKPVADKPKPEKRKVERKRRGETLGLILSWLKENEPATVTHIADKTQIKRESVGIAIRRNSQLFEAVGVVDCPGGGPPASLWKVAG